jgi:hypothetical protein
MHPLDDRLTMKEVRHLWRLCCRPRPRATGISLRYLREVLPTDLRRHEVACQRPVNGEFANSGKIRARPLTAHKRPRYARFVTPKNGPRRARSISRRDREQRDEPDRRGCTFAARASPSAGEPHQGRTIRTKSPNRRRPDLGRRDHSELPAGDCHHANCSATREPTRLGQCSLPGAARAGIPIRDQEESGRSPTANAGRSHHC